MSYFKDPNNNIFDLKESDISKNEVKKIIAAKKLVSISEEEKEDIINSLKTRGQRLKELQLIIQALREKYILTAEIKYKDKKFKGDRGTALEVDAYINAFQRAIPLGLRQSNDIVARWRTQDNSYINLYLEDMISISLLQTQVVANAFAKQETIEAQISAMSDESLESLNIEEYWNNANESISVIG